MYDGKYLSKDGRYYENKDSRQLADHLEEIHKREKKERELNAFRNSPYYQGSYQQRMDNLPSDMIYALMYGNTNEFTIKSLISTLILWGVVLFVILIAIGMLFITSNIFKSFWKIYFGIYSVICVIFILSYIGNKQAQNKNKR